MLSYILSALSVARHAVALTLVASAAATTMVAGSLDQIATQPQHQTASVTTAPTTRPEPTAKAEIALTVSPKSATPETTSRPATSLTPEVSPRPETRTSGIEASGLSASDFWARFAPKATPTTRPQKPAVNIDVLVTECVSKYAAAKNSPTAASAASDACRRAIEASGLSAPEFWTRFAPKVKPSIEPVKPAANIEALVKDCFAKYNAAKDSTTGSAAASEACRRAIEASGLSATEFWAKFGTPQAPKSAPKTTATPTTPELTPLTRYCLTVHAALTTTSSREQLERATAVCGQAIAESRLAPTEFWSKFSAYH